MFSQRVTCLLPALLLAAVAANAMTVTSSPTPPDADIILAQSFAGGTGSYTCSRGVGREAQIGQTFRLTEAAELDRITLRVRPETEVAGALVILFLGTFGDPADTTMDELLVAEVRALPATLTLGSAVYLTFDITNQQLEADRQYGFVVGFSGGDHPGEARLEIFHAGSDAYGEGQAVEWSGLQQTALANDLVFYLQGFPEGSQTDPQPLILLGGRFAIEARWTTASGSGVGYPVKLTDWSGYFWFFHGDNLEVVVKVLDACVDPWQRYWVFMAGLTNVGVSLRVSDLVAGFEHTYENPRGEVFQPNLDTRTFATCALE